MEINNKTLKQLLDDTITQTHKDYTLENNKEKILYYQIYKETGDYEE